MRSSWLPAEAPGSTHLERVLGLRRELYDDYERFASLVWTRSGCSPTLMELCRLRVAQLVRCEAEVSRRTPGAAGVPEAKQSALDGWRDSELFSPAERACLAFAEKFVLDPQSVTDADAAAVAAHLSPKEMIALTEALALFDGFSRFQTILGVRSDGDTNSSPEPPSLGKRRGLEGSPHEATSPLSSQERGQGGEFVSAAVCSERSSIAPTHPRPQALRPPGQSRVPPPPPTDSTDPMDRSVLAHQPELMRAFMRLYGTLWDGVVDHPTKEVARLRNARITNCGYCKNVRFAKAREQGLTEDLVVQIDDGFAQSTLSPRHKLVIRYADVFLTCPSGIDAGLREELQREMSPEEIVELTASLALFMGFSKIAVVLGTAPQDMPTTVIPTPSRPT